MCLEKQHNAGSSTSGEGPSLHRNFWSDSVKTVALASHGKKSVFKESWSLWKGFSRSCDFCISWKGLSSSLMAQSTAGGKQACSPDSWGEVASAEFAVSLLPTLGSLAGFLPRCWCCLWSLNVIYRKINWGYTEWELHIGVSDTYRSYHCFECDCRSGLGWLS